jgi:hypothetical protein
VSVEVMGLVWRSSLPSDEKFVALALADFADSDGRNVYPSQAVIGEMVGKTERRVRDTLRKLESRGIIARDPWPNDGRYRPTNRYRIITATLRPPDETSAPTPDETSPPPPDRSSEVPPDETSYPPGRNVRYPRTKRPTPPDETSADPDPDPEQKEEEDPVIVNTSSSFLDPDPDRGDRFHKLAPPDAPVCPEHGVVGTPDRLGREGHWYHLHTFEERLRSRWDHCAFVVAPPLERPLADAYGHVYRREWP